MDRQLIGNLPAFVPAGRPFVQRLHELPQALQVIRGQVNFHGAGQRSFQAFLPARAGGMQVSASPGQLPGGVNLHTLRPAHQAHQRSLGEHGSAAYTGALRNMLQWFRALARHLGFFRLAKAGSAAVRCSGVGIRYPTRPGRPHRRACVSSWRWSCQDLHRTRSRPPCSSFSCPSSYPTRRPLPRELPQPAGASPV